jgi:penicillin-binding protein 1C
LSDRAARTLTFGLDNHLNTGFWSAAKTGTSKDMRDNWCIGFSQRYTVAVWVGNFEGDAMHDVSGVTGAAPVWHELMSALHQQSPPAAPLPPAGVTTASTKFSPAVEPPRQEWFIDGSQRARTVVAVAGASALPRIVSPANGMIIAIDPDIPAAHQRVPLSAQGANSTMVMTLDDSVVLPANELALWPLIEGSHRLALKDANGVVLDRILFTVR